MHRARLLPVREEPAGQGLPACLPCLGHHLHTSVCTLHTASLQMGPVLSQHATATCKKPLCCCQAGGLTAAWLARNNACLIVRCPVPASCLVACCTALSHVRPAPKQVQQGWCWPSKGAGTSSDAPSTPCALRRPPAGAAPGVSSGVLDCFVKTFKADGPLAFYNGFSSNFARLGE